MYLTLIFELIQLLLEHQRSYIQKTLTSVNNICKKQYCPKNCLVKLYLITSERNAFYLKKHRTSKMSFIFQKEFFLKYYILDLKLN